MAATVVVDTSALMAPVERDVRLFEELERLLGGVDPVVPHAVVDELDGLADGNGEAATAAAVGRDLVRRCRIAETEASYADDAVVELAEREAAAVVTNDHPLRDRLIDRGRRVIGLRGANGLAITEP